MILAKRPRSDDTEGGWPSLHKQAACCLLCSECPLGHEAPGERCGKKGLRIGKRSILALGVCILTRQGRRPQANPRRETSVIGARNYKGCLGVRMEKQPSAEPKMWNASRFCVSSLRRGHANLLCIVPILVYVLPKHAQEGQDWWLSRHTSLLDLGAASGVDIHDLSRTIRP